MADLNATFEAAVANSKNLSERPDNATLLKIYALYKQATAGDNSEKKPSFSDMVGRAKWDAWAKLKGTSQDDAMQQILTIATEFRDRRQREERKHRLNREIMALEVRLSGPDNEPLGVVSITEALRLAGEADVDLVEISPTAVPPVCRLMDYGKFKYAEQKKAAEAKSKQKVIE
eukprot:gene47488-63665_t